MFEENLIKFCAPTLAGIKTASLFSFKYEEINDVQNNIKIANNKLVKKGLRVIPLDYRDGNALIYVYRPKRLKKDLMKNESLKILNSFNYDVDNPKNLLSNLCSRIKNSKDFPHEIGLFLGYPIEDVKGFIENNGKNYKYCDMWKVYGDVDKAKRLFKLYRKASKLLLKEYHKGKTITDLTVNNYIDEEKNSHCF